MVFKVSDFVVGLIYDEMIVDNFMCIQLVQYVGILGDYNLLYMDEVFVKEVVGYLMVFVYGMCIMGMIGKVLINWVGDGWFMKYGVCFKVQVWFGDMFKVMVEVIELCEEEGVYYVDIKVLIVNQDGIEVIQGSVMVCFDF